MSTQIFVNLPVRDLPASRAFFGALGYSANLKFTNDDAACLVISDSIYVMLLVEPFFQGFTKLPIADAKKTTEVLIALSCDSRAEVDEFVAKVAEFGRKMQPQHPLEPGAAMGAMVMRTSSPSASSASSIPRAG